MSATGSDSRFVDFEIELDRRDPDVKTFDRETEYSVEVRYQPVDSQVPVQPKPGIVHFDWDTLSALNALYHPKQYGLDLSNQLFADRVVRESFIRARTSAETANARVRLRIGIGESAGELNDLYWEILGDPLDEHYQLPLSISQQVVFSRYTRSADSQPVRPRALSNIRGLMVICNPANLESDYGLPAIPADELERMEKALAGISLDTLPDQAGRKRATLDNLVDCLRKETYDILYLVCHGTVQDGQPWLFMENDRGQVQRERGDDLAGHIRNLIQRPLLAVLVSCQSVAFGEVALAATPAEPAREAPGDVPRSYTAMRSLGPSLAEAGIPAVLAMHGNLSIPSAATLVTEFFKELLSDGQVDRALAEARFKISHCPDACLPVLFMRLKDGRIWYKTGFYGEFGERIAFDWEFLITDINNGNCTPILGPGLYEWMLGSQRDIARTWARQYDYPLAAHEVESLPSVAQYLRVKRGERFLHTQLIQDLKKEIIRRHGPDLGPADQLQRLSLDELVTSVGKNRRQRKAEDSYALLAQMPFEVYPTSNPGNLLASALEEVKSKDGRPKQPRTLIYPWKDQLLKKIGLPPGREEGYIPTVDQPLVYHLLGRLEPIESLVLTEDDYFNFLIGATKNKQYVPANVQSALTRPSLLFIGFQIQDWNFRVLLSYILSYAGAEVEEEDDDSQRIHVAVQLRPERERLLNPPKAYKYLEELIAYSQKGVKSSIYWGSAADFVCELYENWRKTPR